MGGFALWRGSVREDILRELVYTSREFSGEGAQRWGLVTHVADDPLATAMTIAREIAMRNPHAVRGCKRLFAEMTDGDTASILLAESREQIALMGSPNQVESVRANMEKRAPLFVD
jgi:enoyl-CoA hydratase/carnithine racemase